MFSLICAWTNSWENNGDAGDLRRHRVISMRLIWYLLRREIWNHRSVYEGYSQKRYFQWLSVRLHSLQGPVSIQRPSYLRMVISMLKIRRPLGRLIFNMGIAIPGKTVFLIETAPSALEMELLQYCIKPWVCYSWVDFHQGVMHTADSEAKTWVKTCISVYNYRFLPLKSTYLLMNFCS